MNQTYIKQAFRSLAEHKLVSAVSIGGTALAVAMILVMVILYQIKTGNYRPESNRSRLLYVINVGGENIQDKSWNTAQASYALVKECFYPLTTVETVGVRAVTDDSPQIAVAGNSRFYDFKAAYVDDGYWRVFDFTFLAGKPFSKADFQAGLRRAVVSESVARAFYGTVEAVGRTLLIDSREHIVTGVVKDVSESARNAYAHVWVPYTSEEDLLESDTEGICGSLGVFLLARKKADFPIIRAEIAGQVKRFNTHQRIYELKFWDDWIVDFIDLQFVGTFQKRSTYYLQSALLILFLLLLPAINLAGITLSRMKKRTEEMGIRRAFGATRNTLLRQVLSENLVVTAIGALLGLGLAYVFLFLCRSFLLPETSLFTLEMLIRPATFAAALLLCLAINLLSAGIPAWRISRIRIVQALDNSGYSF